MPDHGELQGAGAPCVVVGEGKGPAWSSERMGSGWGGSERIREREEEWNGAWEPRLLAAGFLPHSRACGERTSLPSLPSSCPSQGRDQVSPLSSSKSMGRGRLPRSNLAKR